MYMPHFPNVYALVYVSDMPILMRNVYANFLMYMPLQHNVYALIYRMHMPQHPNVYDLEWMCVWACVSALCAGLVVMQARKARHVWAPILGRLCVWAKHWMCAGIRTSRAPSIAPPHTHTRAPAHVCGARSARQCGCGVELKKRKKMGMEGQQTVRLILLAWRPKESAGPPLPGQTRLLPLRHSTRAGFNDRSWDYSLIFLGEN